MVSMHNPTGCYATAVNSSYCLLQNLHYVRAQPASILASQKDVRIGSLCICKAQDSCAAGMPQTPLVLIAKGRKGLPSPLQPVLAS